MLQVFLVTLFLALLSGMFLPQGSYSMPALIGGFTAGYLMDENYTDVIVNSGIPVGLVGITYYLVIIMVMNSMILSIANTDFNLLPVMVIGKIFTFFAFGVLGGLLGFVIRQRRLIVQIMR